MKKVTTVGLAVGVSVAGLALVFLVVPALVFRFTGPKLKARVAKVYQPSEIVFEDLRASNFGIESKGAAQRRGNGALVLTAHDLHFFQLEPESDFKIPLDTIKEVTTVRGHLGKTVGRRLLHVTFSVEGSQDAVAFSVTDVDDWLSKLARKPAQNVK